MKLSSGKDIIVFALTGGIGSGKSLALDYFKSKDVPVFSADEIAKKVTRKEGAAYGEILELFGNCICKEDGEPDFAKVSELVFSDAEKLKAYMNLLKPHIIRAVELEIESFFEKRSEKRGFAVLEAPVLFEYGMEKAFDYIILVSSHPEERIRRVMERNGLSRAEVIRRIKSQIPDERKRRASDFEIENNGTKEELEIKLGELYQNMLALAESKEREKNHG